MDVSMISCLCDRCHQVEMCEYINGGWYCDYCSGAVGADGGVE